MYKFHKDNLSNGRLWFAEKLVKITEDLKNLQLDYPLYIAYDCRFENFCYSKSQALLFYLKMTQKILLMSG